MEQYVFGWMFSKRGVSRCCPQQRCGNAYRIQILIILDYFKMPLHKFLSILNFFCGFYHFLKLGNHLLDREFNGNLFSDIKKVTDDARIFYYLEESRKY